MPTDDRRQRILDVTIRLIEQQESSHNTLCEGLSSMEYAEALLSAAASVCLGEIHSAWDGGHVKRSAKLAEEFHRLAGRAKEELLEMVDESIPECGKVLRRRRYLQAQELVADEA